MFSFGLVLVGWGRRDLCRVSRSTRLRARRSRAAWNRYWRNYERKLPDRQQISESPNSHFSKSEQRVEVLWGWILYFHKIFSRSSCIKCNLIFFRFRLAPMAAANRQHLLSSERFCEVMKYGKGFIRSGGSDSLFSPPSERSQYIFFPLTTADTLELSLHLNSMVILYRQSRWWQLCSV